MIPCVTNNGTGHVVLQCENVWKRYDDCATCDDANGAARRRWQGEFSRVPPDIANGPFRHLSLSSAPNQRLVEIARITKFGIAGTDMPGHEFLSDRDIASISVLLQQNVWLKQSSSQSIRNH